MAKNNEDEQLPSVVRQIKQETEELIRLADQGFLRLCGIAWENDIEQPCAVSSE